MATDPKELARQAQRLSVELQILAEMLSDFTQSSSPEPEKVSSDTVKDTVKTPAQEKPQQKRTVRVKKDTYDNDPMSPSYDPEPPMAPDPVPDRPSVVKPSSLIMRKGEMRSCSVCKKPAVKANRDIYAVDNDSEHGLTTKALEILAADLDWPAKIEVDKTKGGLCMTCPLCGKLGLWVIGSDKQKNEQSRYETGSL